MVAHINIFDQPQGDMRGVVSAEFMVKGREKVVAHAYLIANKPLKASLRLPTSGYMSLNMIRDYANELLAFADAVESA